MTPDPSSAAATIVGEGHRRYSQASTLAKEGDGVVIRRHEPIFKIADRGIDLPRYLSRAASPPSFLYILDQE